MTSFDAPAPHAFLSYARADGESFASALRDRLEHEHPEITLWQDRRRLEGGVGWWKQITEAIDRVEFIIMVMTPGVVSSETSRKEWQYARQQGVRVCPVLGVPPRQLDIESLPRWMRKAHFYDLDNEWDTFVAFLKSARRDTRVPFMAPDLRDDFVPRRKEFDALLSAVLTEGHHDPVVITTALQGAGGFGKTTLAVALCHDENVIAAFDDGILWATLGESPKIQHELTKLYAALTGERPYFVDVDDAAIQLAERLDQKNCLLVIDDVWDPNHVTPFLRGGKQCARLITTRRLDVVTETRAQKISVDEMTGDQSVQLLVARLPSPPSDQSRLRELAHRLGEWPLLLKLAASQLRERMERGDSFEGALAYIEMALKKRGPVAFDRTNASARNDAVSRTLGASLELLSPDDRTRCAQLAILPEATLIPLSAVSALWELDDFDTQEIVQRLDTAAVIDFDIKIGGVRIHGVLQAYLRAQLPDIPALHARLVTTGWPDTHALPDAYAWRWFSWHLAQAGQHDRLCTLLWDYSWIHEKLRRSDVQTLLQDFDLVAGRGELQRVHDVIQLASHGLARDRAQLAAQLAARLEPGHAPEIDHLLSEARRLTPRPWFQLRHTSLTHAGGALLGILKGHTAPVEGVAISSDGKSLVSAAGDWTVRLWDHGAGRTVKTFSGHTGPVFCVALSPNGLRAVSGSEDRTIRVWDLDTGHALAVLKGHTAAVFGVAFSPDGESIASISEDRTVRTWNLSSERSTPQFTGFSHQLRAIAWMPDGRHLVFAPEHETIARFSIDERRIVATYRGHEGLIKSIAVTRDGRRILSTSVDRTVRVFDVFTGDVIRELRGHRNEVDCVAVTSDGRWAVSGSKDATLRVWDLESGETVTTLDGHASFIRGVAIAPDSSRAISASSDKTIRQWNLHHRSEVSSKSTAGPVSILAIAAGGTRALSGSRNSPLSVWDVARGRVIGTLTGHLNLSVNPPRPSQTLAIVSAATLLEDGAAALTASRDATLRLWDVDREETRHTLVGHSDAVLKMAVSADGRYAASLGRDRTVRLWNMTDGTAIRALASEDNARAMAAPADPLLLELGKQVAFDFTRSTINRDAEIVISADGRYVLVGDDSGMLAWDVRTGRTIKERLDDFFIVALALGPGTQAILGSRTGWIKLWDFEIGATIRTFKAHERPILDIAVNVEEGRLVTAGRDDVVRVWQLEDLSPSGTLEGTIPGVNEVAVSPDTRTAYSIYEDTIVASDLVRLAHVGSVSFDHRITVIALSADGADIAAGDESGAVHFLEVER